MEYLEKILGKSYLKERLGDNYKQKISMYLQENRISLFSKEVSYKYYEDTLTKMFNCLKNSSFFKKIFSTEELKDWIYINLADFIHLSVFRVFRNVSRIESFLQDNFSANPSLIPVFLKVYGIKLLSIGSFALVQKNIDYVSKTFGLSKEKATVFIFKRMILFSDIEERIEELYNEVTLMTTDLDDIPETSNLRINLIHYDTHCICSIDNLSFRLHTIRHRFSNIFTDSN